MIKRVLLVDDSKFMREWLKEILQNSPFDFEVISETENVIQAVLEYTRVKPDVVVMDITLPKMNDVQALEQIILRDSTATVVMCSSMGQDHLIKKCQQIGAKNFIIKPYFNHLASVLHSVTK